MEILFLISWGTNQKNQGNIMSKKESSSVKLIRGILGTQSGSNEVLTFTSKGVIYLRKQSKSKAKKK